MGAACASTCVGQEEQHNEQVDDIYGAKTIEKGTHRSDNHNGYATMPNNRLHKQESSEVPEGEIMKLVKA